MSVLATNLVPDAVSNAVGNNLGNVPGLRVGCKDGKEVQNSHTENTWEDSDADWPTHNLCRGRLTDWCVIAFFLPAQHDQQQCRPAVSCSMLYTAVACHAESVEGENVAGCIFFGGRTRTFATCYARTCP